jgi:hypothetical protein
LATTFPRSAAEGIGERGMQSLRSITSISSQIATIDLDDEMEPDLLEEIKMPCESNTLMRR